MNRYSATREQARSPLRIVASRKRTYSKAGHHFPDPNETHKRRMPTRSRARSRSPPRRDNSHAWSKQRRNHSPAYQKKRHEDDRFYERDQRERRHKRSCDGATGMCEQGHTRCSSLERDDSRVTYNRSLEDQPQPPMLDHSDKLLEPKNAINDSFHESIYREANAQLTVTNCTIGSITVYKNKDMPIAFSNCTIGAITVHDDEHSRAPVGSSQSRSAEDGSSQYQKSGVVLSELQAPKMVDTPLPHQGGRTSHTEAQCAMSEDEGQSEVPVCTNTMPDKPPNNELSFDKPPLEYRASSKSPKHDHSQCRSPPTEIGVHGDKTQIRPITHNGGVRATNQVHVQDMNGIFYFQASPSCSARSPSRDDCQSHAQAAHSSTDSIICGD